MKLHPDFSDFIKALNASKVDYVIVGAYALAFHGFPRATGDIDFWVCPERENAENVLMALKSFGFGGLDIRVDDLLSGKIIQLGFPPVRIDILSKLTGLSTREIRESRQESELGGDRVFFLGRAAYIKNKRSVGRYKDLADLELLEDKPRPAPKPKKRPRLKKKPARP
jgi:hypothetical protein